MEMSALFTLNELDRTIGDFRVGLAVQRHPDRKTARGVFSNGSECRQRSHIPAIAEPHPGTLFGVPRSPTVLNFAMLTRPGRPGSWSSIRALLPFPSSRTKNKRGCCARVARSDFYSLVPVVSCSSLTSLCVKLYASATVSLNILYNQIAMHCTGGGRGTGIEPSPRSPE